MSDSKGFVYYVVMDHTPQFGFTTAYYNGSIIGQCELGRILQPMGDDDREWEMYGERFAEWRDEVISNMIITCREYFDKQ